MSTSTKALEHDPAVLAAKLPREIADAMRDGRVTLAQARIAESFGLVDVWDLPGKRYCACMTEFGREVCVILDDSGSITS